METQERKRQQTKKRRPAPQRTRTASRKQDPQVRRRRRASANVRSKPAQHRQTRPRRQTEVVYTPAKPFNRSRFFLQLLTVFAVVLALTLSISIFFKVEQITVSGNEKYNAWAIQQASGIQMGENLLTFGEAHACSKILLELPYVKHARMGIKLPDTVNIYIEEYEVVYAAEATDGSWWLIRSDGKLVEKTDPLSANDYAKLQGVRIQNPQPGQQAVAYENPVIPNQNETTAGEMGITAGTQPVTYTDAERLNMALVILQELEANHIIGKVVSVDVTDPAKLQMWYGKQYFVELGDSEDLAYKINYMKKAIDQLGEYQTGTLDVSFDIWTDKAGLTPFPEE